MKKFGIGSKKDKPEKAADEVDESSRSRLFGTRIKNKTLSPAPASSNPYAVPTAPPSGNPYANISAPPSNPYASGGNNAYGGNGSNPYAQKSVAPDPYAQNSRGGSPALSGGYAKPPDNPYNNPYGNRNGGSSALGQRPLSSGTQPPAYEAAGYPGADGSGYRNEKSPPPPSGGYGRYNNPGEYGNQSGYGADRWSETSSIATTRVGGYGGFGGHGGYGGYGRADSRETLETDAGREALFGGAKERAEQKQTVESKMAPEDDPAQGYGGGSGEDSRGYGRDYDRQLTAEEQEEEDVQVTKNEIRDIKREDVSTLRNAMRTAAQAEETGRATLERLGLQGERIHNAEKNLDLSANQSRVADEKYREIKRLNRSMFAPNVGNPFTKARRQREMDDAVIETHHREKARREATRSAAYESMERQQGAQRRLRDAWEKEHNPEAGGAAKAKGKTLAERSKYQFEADSEDEAMEDEIDSNLDALSGAAGRLNLLGKAIGAELESQNEHIGRIAGKVDVADDQLEMLRAKLARVK